jgi:hypothetical protein
MREVKVETFVAASSVQFDATYERAISTLGPPLRHGITNTWSLESGIYCKPNFPALFSLAVLGVILATHR